MAAYRYHTLDVFTASRFGGNQLAVVLDADGLDQETMQTVAREFNFSETTFVRKPTDPGNTANVKIFTPGSELPFAGHPTVGTAALLARLSGATGDTEIRLEEVAGLVPVAVNVPADGAAYGTLTSPVLPGMAEEAPDAATLAAALQIDVADIGFESHAPGFVSASSTFLCVPVASLDALARASLDPARQAQIRGDRHAVEWYVYTSGGKAADTDFRARMFAPDIGIAEDPATGAAAATFPGQILSQEKLADGSYSWRVEQGYEMGRPSELDIHADVADGAVSAVRVGGHAVDVMQGTIEI